MKAELETAIRIEQHNPKVRVPMLAALQETDHLAQLAEQGRAIWIDVACDLHVAIDPLRGRQALGNLVDNALRHGTGDIGLSAREDGGAVELDVSDEGPGFPREFVARAFERFARGDPTRASNGTGLGLAIVRAIAQADGGTTMIIDSPSPGSTVRLRAHEGKRLRRLPSEAPDCSPRSQQGPSTSPVRQPRRGRCRDGEFVDASAYSSVVKQRAMGWFTVSLS